MQSFFPYSYHLIFTIRHIILTNSSSTITPAAIQVFSLSLTCFDFIVLCDFELFDDESVRIG